MSDTRNKSAGLSLRERFEQFNDDFLQFDRIENPRHPRPDLCAFLLLHDLVPATGDMIDAAEHDEFYLSTNVDALQLAASDEDILVLVRCGVRYSGGCLAMFA